MLFPSHPGAGAAGVGGEGTKVAGASGGGGGLLRLWQGQKQSSKVPGFLEKAWHKDSFVQLAKPSGPRQHRGCVCHAPPAGKPSPAHLLLPRVLRTSFLLLIYFYFIYICSVFLMCLHRLPWTGGSAPPRCPPIFWGPAWGRGIPPAADARAPLGKWPALCRNGTAPGKNALCCCEVLKKMRLFLQQFSIYFG